MSTAQTPDRDIAGQWSDDAIIIEETTVAYRRRSGTTMPIVFLHGFADNGDCFQGLLARLPEHCDAVLLDSAAHGRSGIPADGAHEVSRRRITIEFLRQVTGPAVLIGHSMGASTALSVAAAAPDLVLALVMEDPPWFAAELEVRDAPATMMDLEDRLIQWILALQDQSVEKVEADRRASCPHWDEIEYGYWAHSKHAIDKKAADYPYLRLPEAVADQWDGVMCPSLLITGNPDLSAIVTDEVAAQFLAAVPTSTRSNHPKAGHDVRRDDPAGVSAAITEFIMGIDAARSNI